VNTGDAEARGEAADAASAAGVVIRPAEVEPLIRFLDSIWGAGRSGDPSFLTAISHAGNSVLIAERDGEPIGAALGVLGWADGVHLHSHMVAVDPRVRSVGVGFALKLAQRDECLAHGVTEMRWTFDPLIRRNAHFNLVKLGAEVLAFHPDFYGVLADEVNGTDATDRFEVSWRLDGPLGRHPATRTDLLLPADYERLRREDPDAAGSMRTTSRGALSAASRIRFTGDGYELS
jgi:predicted GNAT superfamily acetyltransferase